MMAMDRRQFLKITGLSALLGLGGKTALQVLAPGEAEAAIQQANKIAGKKWGMALDVTLLDEEIMSKCIQACHTYYNVPNIGKLQRGAQVDLERNLRPFFSRPGERVSGG